MNAWLAILDWLHIGSAAAWVGSALFVGLALPSAPDQTFYQKGILGFHRLANLALLGLLVTGILQILPREMGASPLYDGLLGVKILLLIAGFALAGSGQKKARRLLAAIRNAEPSDWRALQGRARLHLYLGLAALLAAGFLRFGV